MLKSTSCSQQARQPRITWSKVPAPALVDAVRIVHLARAVDAEADEEVVLA